MSNIQLNLFFQIMSKLYPNLPTYSASLKKYDESGSLNNMIVMFEHIVDKC